MFIFGHVGIGRALVGPKGRALPAVPLAVGMILPDLLDKTLYYARFSDFISCTRTFGHTGLAVTLLALVALARRSPAWIAVAIGAATHLLLDFLLDLTSGQPSAELIAFWWPLLSRRFATYYFGSPFDQLAHSANWRVFVTEVIGFALLVWEYRRRGLRAFAGVSR